MITLAIDSATEACSVALLQDGKLLAGAYQQLGRGHAEHLIPMIEALPNNGKADRIAVSIGPGSFTGVRVGIAAARALAFAWGAELVGYPTLTLIAAMAQKAHSFTPTVSVMTGGHGEWFTQSFDAHCAPSSELASLSPADAIQRYSEELIAGSQAEAFAAARQSGHALLLWPDARQVGLLPASAFSDHVQPLYGRAPDAKLPGGITPQIAGQT